MKEVGLRSRNLVDDIELEDEIAAVADMETATFGDATDRRKSWDSYYDSYYNNSYSDDYYDSGDTAREKTLEVTNLAFQQPFGGFFVMVHNDETEPLFTLGEASSVPLAVLAETGDPQELLNHYNGQDGVYYLGTYSVGAPFGAGETINITVPFIRGNYNRITIAAMAINTNDCFVAVNGLILGQGDVVVGPGYDAGSEENNELCSSVPGPACPPGSGNEVSGNGEGVVHVHRGIRGVGDLSESEYAWLNPMLRVVAYNTGWTEPPPPTSPPLPDASCSLSLMTSEQARRLGSTHHTMHEELCHDYEFMRGMGPFIQTIRDRIKHDWPEEDPNYLSDCGHVTNLMSRDPNTLPQSRRLLEFERQAAARKLEDADCIAAVIDVAIDVIFDIICVFIGDELSEIEKVVKDGIEHLLKDASDLTAKLSVIWSSGESDGEMAWETLLAIHETVGVDALKEIIEAQLSWWDAIKTGLEFIADILAVIATAGGSFIVEVAEKIVDIVADVGEVVDACT